MYEDLTSRIYYHIQKAEFYGLKEHGSTKLLVEAADAIKDLNKTLDEEVEINTALEISQKHGKWLTSGYFAECSECKYEFAFDDYLPDVSMMEDLHMNFCPNCGARMVNE